MIGFIVDLHTCITSTYHSRLLQIQICAVADQLLEKGNVTPPATVGFLDLS